MYKGMLRLNNAYYYFDPDTGKQHLGKTEVEDGSIYYFSAEGEMCTGFQETQGVRNYFSPDTYKLVTGLHSIGDHLYYFDELGNMVTDATISLDGVTYKIDSEGATNVVVDQSNPVSVMMSYAVQYLGTPYGHDENALVCSTFASLLLKSIGHDLEGSSYQMYQITRNDPTKYTELDSIDNLEIGDLLFFIGMDCDDDNCEHINEIHHVAIYVGDGKIVEETKGGAMLHEIGNLEDSLLASCVHIK